MSDPKPDDRSWIETIERELRPRPMDARRAVAFRRALDEKRARRAARRRAILPTLASAAAAAALALWLVRPVADAPASRADATGTVAFDAFVDPDAGAGEIASAAGYLPGDYLVLANLLDDATP